MILIGDASGAPVAYRWSLGGRAVAHSCTIAMARLSPPTVGLGVLPP
jgi:hypothetical protein